MRLPCGCVVRIQERELGVDFIYGAAETFSPEHKKIVSPGNRSPGNNYAACPQELLRCLPRTPHGVVASFIIRHILCTL